MRVFCTGFNLYGQFIKCPTIIVDAFVDYLCDATFLEPSHTFNVVVASDGVYVHGSKQDKTNDKTHQMHKLTNNNHDIKQISCVDTRILLLFKNGNLHKCNFHTGVIENVAKNIEKVSCGVTINVAITTDGGVLNLPYDLHFKSNAKDVATGREHCIILDKQGRVYSFGCGSRGQLGHGNLENESEPKAIEALDGIKIGKIAAGGWHSCAISVEGDLYVWGWNVNGQLGLYANERESIAVIASPRPVDFDDCIDVNVVDVACGHRHTIALLDNGKLYGTGWNKYSQLGNVTAELNVYKFRLIYDFNNIAVKELKCGPWSSLVISS